MRTAFTLVLILGLGALLLAASPVWADTVQVATCAGAGCTTFTNSSFPVTQYTPISAGLPVGAGTTTDQFLWNAANFTLAGTVSVDNVIDTTTGICSLSACTTLSVTVTATDTNGAAGAIRLTIDQTFATPSNFTSLTSIPSAALLAGSCNSAAAGAGSSVSAFSQFDFYPAVSAPGTLTASCSAPFNLSGSQINPNLYFGDTFSPDIDINTQVTFNFGASTGPESITLPVGACEGTSCVVPASGPPTVPEPSSLILLGPGMLGLLCYGKRRMWPAPRG